MYTNKINGKKYIGKTWRKNVRHRTHMKADGDCRAFHAAVRKYGSEAFSYEILHDGVDDDVLLELLEWLEVFQRGTLAPNGYNLKEGGDGGARLSQETKDMIGRNASRRYQDPRNREKTSKAKKAAVTDDFKKKMSEVILEKYNDPEYRKRRLDALLQKTKDEEWRRNHALAMKKAKSVAVVCIENGTIYPSIQSVPRDLGRRHVGCVCRGIRKTSGGLHWRYATPEEVALIREKAIDNFTDSHQ